MEKYTNINAQLHYDSSTDKFSKFIIPHPLSICYKVTRKCNFNCPHCITSSSMNEWHWLDTEKAFEVIRRIAKSWIRRLDITWWEPFLREDMDEIIKLASELWLEVVVTTNWSKLSTKSLELLSRLKIFTQISIDWPKDLNDALRMKWSYDIAISAIKKFEQYGIPTRINCVLQKNNIHIFDQMIEIAKENKVANLYFILVSAQWRVFEDPNRFCLSEETEKEIKAKILSLRQKDWINVKMLDFKKYTWACTLIDSNWDFISQSHSEDKCINVWNILENDLNDLWINSWAFDHALHLMQYIRHPMLYS